MADPQGPVRPTHRPAGPVKVARSARRFGVGILPPYPVYMSDHTADDEAWLAALDALKDTSLIGHNA